MRKILVFCLFAAVLIGATKPSLAEVAPTTLEQLIKVSKFALVGKVTRIIDIEGSKIAEATVLGIMKGDRRVRKVYFVAQPTWACDTSDAVLNETALLFLDSEPAGVDEASPFSKKLREAIGDNPLLLITWSGRGRLPVTSQGQLDYIHILADSKMADVRFPKQIATIPMTNSQDGSVRLARLEDVVSFIKRKAS